MFPKSKVKYGHYRVITQIHATSASFCKNLKILLVPLTFTQIRHLPTEKKLPTSPLQIFFSKICKLIIFLLMAIEMTVLN